MKHFYTLLLAMLACVLPAQAETVQLQLTVDNPAAVTVYQGDKNWTYDLEKITSFPTMTVDEGENTISYEGVLYFVANDGYLIVEKNGPASYNQEILPNNGKYAYINSYSSYHAGTYSIVTQSDADFYDASLTVKCDDFSKLEFQWPESEWSGTSFYPEIPEGATEITIPFSTKYRSQIKFTHKDYQSFYKVTVDGTPVECGSSYTMPLADANGKTVEILCNYPEIECHVKVTFANEGTEGAVSSVSIDGEKVENVDFNDIVVMCGKNLSLNFNTDSYQIQNITFNGENRDTWGFYNQIVKDSELVITAKEYATYTKTLNITGAEFIKRIYYRNSNYDNFSIEPVEGESSFEYKENATDLIIELDTHFATLVALTNNDVDIMDSYNGYGSINLMFSAIAEGTLVIDLQKILRDKLMVVYYEADPATYWSNFQTTKDSYSFQTKQGYNLIEFSTEDGDFRASWSNSNDSKDNLYINDVKQPFTGYDRYYIFTPADNDVVKIFQFSDPEPVELSFETVGDNVQAEGTKDIITPVDLNSTYTVLPGTQVNLKSLTSRHLLVKVGDEPEVDVPSHEFTVTKDTHVVIKDSTTLGVEDVTVEAADDNAAVYNLQGVKVATKAQMDRLPKGIYVVGGVKVVK